MLAVALTRSWISSGLGGVAERSGSNGLVISWKNLCIFDVVTMTIVAGRWELLRHACLMFPANRHDFTRATDV